MKSSLGIIGGADGPTAILVSGEDMLESFLSGVAVGAVVGVIAGVALTLAVIGIIKLIKKNKK